ncbi:MAG: VWA domain-containing protein [Gemmataceae bacterium]|nr:VWA domain-containing protein [Gemmataceae bacterium]
MFRQFTQSACVLVSGVFLTAALGAQEPPKVAKKPQVEVVFCLDTTGSMGGLISAAKQKIWTISNQIAAGNPTPNVKIGLVAYRDRGDQYVTKVFDLTDDLDGVYQNLMGLQAQGGGDTPESVNQALNEAVTKVAWSKDKKTLKMIFLVGDAPPHMNYPDDVKYQDTCKIAVTNDIIINTVQCGNIAGTQKYWQDICRLAEGSYVQIDQAGGPIVVTATPFDKELAKINTEISKTTLVFGAPTTQQAGKEKAKLNEALPPGAAAERAAFNARNFAGGVAYDLLTNVQNGTVKLENLKKDELPPELQKLTLDEQKAYLKKLEDRRKELSTQALALDKQRNEFIQKILAEDTKNAAANSFDGRVLQILQTQGNRNGSVQYGNVEKKK